MPFPRASNAVLLAASLDLASSSSSPLARLVSPEQFVAPPVLLRDLTVCGMMDRFKEERAELAKLLEKILLELLGEVIKVSLAGTAVGLASQANSIFLTRPHPTPTSLICLFVVSFLLSSLLPSLADADAEDDVGHPAVRADRLAGVPSEVSRQGQGISSAAEGEGG